MRTIAICNQKGGVGKTTTTLALQSGLMQKGLKTLILDFDGQRNSTSTKGQTEGASIYDVLTKGADIRDAIAECPSGDIVRGDERLSGIDSLSIDTLRNTLKPLHRQYDIVLIDCPPSLGVLTLNALMASDYVIVPAVADKYSLHGIIDLAQTIEAVKSENKRLRVLGVLLTMHNAKYRLSKELESDLEEITKAFKTTLFDTSIRYSQKVREAQFRPEGLMKYAPRATVTEDYKALTEEIIKRLEK